MARKLLQEGMTLKIQRVRNHEFLLVDDCGCAYDFMLSPEDEHEQATLRAELIPKLSPIVSSGKTILEVHIDDTVCLRSKSEQTTATLNRCGHWWKIVQASAVSEAHPKARWFLRSLTLKEQGLRPRHGFSFENLWIDKENDPCFEIVRVCPNPKPFNYREYE
jgi:hypothetical protein